MSGDIATTASSPADRSRHIEAFLNNPDAYACKTAGVNMYPRKGSRVEFARAVAVCQACAVRLGCLEHALETGEVFGIWGGHSERARARIRRVRRVSNASTLSSGEAL